ncbi:hypothetical protein [Dialister sp.]|jgi:hypothetical protein|uniref:hypothetical protein n=1 Tax=Dialister sp. TaxID=1955814 RepID=UPI00406D51F3
MKEEFTEELVRRARDGDMVAKGKLCQQFKDSIYRMARMTFSKSITSILKILHFISIETMAGIHISMPEEIAYVSQWVDR